MKLSSIPVFINITFFGEMVMCLIIFVAVSRV